MTQHQRYDDIFGDLDGVKVLYDEPMSRHASLRLGGRADALVITEHEAQLLTIVRRLKKSGIAFMPVGNLTNLIVRDGGYRGVILWMRGLEDVHMLSEPAGVHCIEAQAGASLSRVVSLAAARELTGFEFCAGIPGSVGGALWMNAGAYGSEIKDVLVSMTVIDGQGEMKVLRREDISFGYRVSNLPADVIILKAVFQLVPGDGASIRGRIAEIIAWRHEKHPLRYPSAGSVFKNPPGLPAGRLIEDLGLKGMRRGDAQVSTLHANFIVNKGRATADDVLALIHLIQDKAEKEKGIVLDTEVIIVGENP
ncbi:MAG: UDP-N-acetylmuramate dehydrogenase [Smithellaceae bacterium]